MWGQVFTNCFLFVYRNLTLESNKKKIDWFSFLNTIISRWSHMWKPMVLCLFLPRCASLRSVGCSLDRVSQTCKCVMIADNIWKVDKSDRILSHRVLNPPVRKPIWVALQKPRQLLRDVFHGVNVVHFRLPKRFCVQVVNHHLDAEQC